MKPTIKNIGKVQTIKDGVISLDGLSEGVMGGMIRSTSTGMEAMILNLTDEDTGAIVFGDFTKITENEVFENSGEVMSVTVDEAVIGRVLDGVAHPIDGKGALQYSNGAKVMPVERIAPGVIERQPVNQPVQTGIMAVDAMTPIGRGQRQLVIGDRGTGKTALAVDTILNQKVENSGIICIYVGIGQKQARIAQLVEKLDQHGAMEYTVVVNASASDSVAMQYLAPYTATAIGEYFMEKGRDVLIIYDDLTKHAWAYRQISLILERPPGREAYPGDVFYLHSRLLERSCRLSADNGGGSITALPIVETQLGDVSAYIPTNIISITDGQIYFETDLFNSGIRPAVDPSNSVSRVGGAAQIKAMKKVAGRLRLALAQFKELEAFAQFGSADLDASTKERIERGQRIRELLKQPQYRPLPVYIQVGLIHAANQGHLDEVPLEDIDSVKERFISFMETKSDQSMYEELVEEFFNR